MSRSRLWLAAALCSVTLAAVPHAQESGGFGDAKETTLTEMRKRPQAYKNVWVKFSGSFLSTSSVHNPFFTRFTRADFVNFAVWGDEQKIWNKKDYDNACSTLFVSKKNDAGVQVVYTLQRYTRVECLGVVRNAFQGEPWIEITKVTPIAEKVTTATLSHMYRASEHIKNHNWKKAGVELNLAWTPGLPPQIRGWISNYRGIALMRLGNWISARQQIAQAASLLPNEPEIVENLRILKVDPKSAIDQTVKKTQVAKNKRPFWEAVEKDTGKKSKTTKLGKKTGTETTKQPVAGPGK